MKEVKDSLAGRAEYLRLHPCGQGELHGRREKFVPGLAGGGFPSEKPSTNATSAG